MVLEAEGEVIAEVTALLEDDAMLDEVLEEDVTLVEDPTLLEELELLEDAILLELEEDTCDEVEELLAVAEADVREEDVDPLATKTLTELVEEELLEVVVATVDAKVDEALPALYSSKRLPSPQYWYELPAHFMLHSPKGAVLLVAAKVLPQ